MKRHLQRASMENNVFTGSSLLLNICTCQTTGHATCMTEIQRISFGMCTINGIITASCVYRQKFDCELCVMYLRTATSVITQFNSKQTNKYRSQQSKLQRLYSNRKT